MEIKNVEQTYNLLTRAHDDVVISAQQAAEIFSTFTGSNVKISDFSNFKYRAFLQAAMMGWLDGSAAIGYVQALWAGSVKPTATISSIIKALLKEALKQYYQRELAGKPGLYELVRVTILQQNRPYFDMVGQGMELP